MRRWHFVATPAWLTQWLPRVDVDGGHTTRSMRALRRRKEVSGDVEVASEALHQDAAAKLARQAGADNTMNDVLGDESADLITNPPAVPANTPERDKKNKAIEKQAKKAKKKTDVFYIKVSTGPHGTVAIPPDGEDGLGTIAVMQGEPQTFDFIPDEGCKLVRPGTTCRSTVAVFFCRAARPESLQQRTLDLLNCGLR